MKNTRDIWVLNSVSFFYKYSWLILFEAYTHKTNIFQLLTNNQIYQYTLIFWFISTYTMAELRKAQGEETKNIISTKRIRIEKLKSPSIHNVKNQGIRKNTTKIC